MGLGVKYIPQSRGIGLCGRWRAAGVGGEKYGITKTWLQQSQSCQKTAEETSYGAQLPRALSLCYSDHDNDDNAFDLQSVLSLLRL